MEEPSTLVPEHMVVPLLRAQKQGMLVAESRNPMDITISQKYDYGWRHQRADIQIDKHMLHQLAMNRYLDLPDDAEIVGVSRARRGGEVLATITVQWDKEQDESLPLLDGLEHERTAAD